MASNAENVSIWWRHHVNNVSYIQSLTNRLCLSHTLFYHYVLNSIAGIGIFISFCRAFHIIPPYWNGTGSWNPFSWGTRTYLHILYSWKNNFILGLKTWALFSIKMSPYQYMKSHCGGKTILRPSHLHNGISYTGKMASSYWIGALATKGVKASTAMILTQFAKKDSDLRGEGEATFN